jgi:hypothetical protein
LSEVVDILSTTEQEKKMPYKLIKHKDGTASVKNAETGQYHSKKTTLAKAKAQIRLLQAIDHGFRLRKK